MAWGSLWQRRMHLWHAWCSTNDTSIFWLSSCVTPQLCTLWSLASASVFAYLYLPVSISIPVFAAASNSPPPVTSLLFSGTSKHVLKIDPTTGESSLIGGPFEGRFKWLRGGVVGDEVFGVPSNADTVLRIRPKEVQLYVPHTSSAFLCLTRALTRSSSASLCLTHKIIWSIADSFRRV